MEQINSNTCIFTVIFTQITSFFIVGSTLSILNPSTPAIKAFINGSSLMRYDLPATDDEITLIFALAQAMLTVGSIVGVAFLPWVLQLFSRCGSLRFFHLLNLIGSVLTSPVAKYGHSYEALILGRLLQGLARGIAFTVTPLIVAELPNKKTVSFYQLYQYCLTQTAIALGNALAHPNVIGNNALWPYLLAVPAVPSVIYLSVSYWLKEPPTWLILQDYNNKKEQDIAKRFSFQVLKKMRRGNTATVKREYIAIEQEIEIEKCVTKASFIDIIKRPGYRGQMFAVIIIMLSLQGLGIQAVFQYTNSILETAGVNSDHTTFYAIGINILMGLAVVASSFGHRRFGSKILLLTGQSMAVLGLILLTISTIGSGNNPQLAKLAIASIFIFALGSGMGPMTTMAAYPTEVTIATTRPKIFWIGGVSFWTFASITAFVFPYTIEEIGGYNYIIFVGISILMGCYIKFFVPDTHKKSIYEIQSYFQTYNAPLKSMTTTASYREDNTEDNTI